MLATVLAWELPSAEATALGLHSDAVSANSHDVMYIGPQHFIQHRDNYGASRVSGIDAYL